MAIMRGISDHKCKLLSCSSRKKWNKAWGETKQMNSKRQHKTNKYKYRVQVWWDNEWTGYSQGHAPAHNHQQDHHAASLPKKHKVKHNTVLVLYSVCCCCCCCCCHHLYHHHNHQHHHHPIHTYT